MSEVKITAEPRTEFGKGGARRTRRAGKVPAVLYGHGEKPTHIALPAREFAAAIRHGGINQLFAIELSGGNSTLALPKAIQKDPVRDTYEHVDLLIVRRGEKVTVEVPVHLVGEAAKDTLVMVEHDRLSIVADAAKLPESLDVSIEGLTAGSHVTAGQVTLPDGAELAVEPDLSLAVVTNAPTAEELEATIEEPTAEVAEEGAEAEEAEGEAAEGETAEDATAKAESAE